MTRQEHQAFAKRVVHYYINIARFNKNKTFHQFRNEGRPKSTIFHILQRYEKNKSPTCKKILGRPVSQATPKVVQAIRRIFMRTPSTSVNEAARKLKLPRSTLGHIKRKRLGMRAFVKSNAPKYIKDQKSRAKTGCRKIYKKALHKILIIDDETMVPMDPSDVPGRKFFHAVDRYDVQYEEKIIPKAKFRKQFMVWLAIDETGAISKPFITDKTMNGEVYLRECIKQRLVPFINAHQNKNILFWPDMATCHYSHIVTDYLRMKKIDFIEKTDNAPNVPQARGIEMFWAHCKREYARRPKPSKNIQGFRRVWGQIVKSVAAKSGRAVMDHAWKNLRAIGYKGVDGANLI